MKRILLFLIFFGLLFTAFLLYYSCSDEELPPLFEPDTTQEIRPLTGDTVESTVMDDEYTPMDTEDLTPKLPLGSNESLLRVLNVNLDLDRLEEQIIVIKEKNSVNSYISIAILDYDNVIKDYRRTWQGKTLSTNIRGFTITLSDLIGDHNMELICSGVSLEGKQSLTVFRKTKGDGSPGIYYSEIFNLQANGAIEILEIERSKSYQSGLRDGLSFPIISTVQNTESDNIMDLIKSTFYWDFPSRQYVKVNEEKLLGRELENEQLGEIYRSTHEVFIEHIDGPWMMNNGSETIINFDADEQRITFYSDETQEVYIWTNSYKLLKNVLMVSGRNELINHVENVITIRMLNLNTLQISVRDIDTQTRIKNPNDFWSGQFFYLSDDIRRGMNAPRQEKPTPKLYGTYTGDTGTQIFFDGTIFEYSSEDESFRGGYSMYYIDEYIFSLRIFDKNGIPEKTRTFRYEFEEENYENTIQRILTLYEGRMLIFGFESFNNPRMRFEQIEIREDNTGFSIRE